MTRTEVMSDQMFLFQTEAIRKPKQRAHVEAETRAALDQVEENTDEDWAADALAAVQKTCIVLEEFISDDVWRVGQLDSTHEDRALGPVLLQAKRNRWCVKTDRMRPSLRSHLSGKPVWKSLVCVKELD